MDLHVWSRRWRRGRRRGLNGALAAIAVAAVVSTASAGGIDAQSLVAFATGGDGGSKAIDIALARPDGSGFRNLTHHDPGGDDPVWAADGRSMVISTYDASSGLPAFWRLGADGGHRQRLPGGEWDAPSPDGRLVALLGAKDILVRDATGRLVRRLSAGRLDDMWDGPPIWSPDSRYLALPVDTETENASYQRTWLVPVDGRPSRVVAHLEDPPVAFSPDSRWLLTWRAVTSVDGRVRYVLHGGIRSSWAEAWSPDGRRIAYVGAHGGIYVTLAHDGRGQLVAPTAAKGKAIGSIGLAWGPSGTTIAFSEQAGLYLLDVTSGRVRKLTSACSFCSPSWRPNGSAIAFSRQGEVLVASLPAGRLRHLVGPPLDAESPVWAPDRLYLAFTRGTDLLRDEETLAVFVVRSDGSGLRRLGRGYGPQ